MLETRKTPCQRSGDRRGAAWEGGRRPRARETRRGVRERGGHREAADLPVVIQQELAGDQRGEENAARQQAAEQAAGVLPSRADGELEQARRRRSRRARRRHAHLAFGCAAIAIVSGVVGAPIRTLRRARLAVRADGHALPGGGGHNDALLEWHHQLLLAACGSKMREPRQRRPCREPRRSQPSSRPLKGF